MFRGIVILGVAGVIAAGALWNSLRSGVPVDVARVTTGPIDSWIEERAKTRLPEIHRVTMPLAGRVRPITFREGDRVSIGQVVAELDTSDLDSELAESLKQVHQQERLVESMTSMIASSQAQIRAREAKQDFVTRELERRTGAVAARAFSESDKDAARLLKIEADIDVTKDRLQLNMYEAMEAYTKLGLEDAFVKKNRRERDRNRAEIRSPADGIVLKRHESSERVRPAGEVLLEIGRMEDLEVEAEILTQDAVRIPLGARALMEGVAPGAPALTGKVHRIYPQGFTKISSLGVEQQRVLVIIRFDDGALERFRDAGKELGIDYRVRARIMINHRDDVKRVARSTLFRSPSGGWQCFVVRENRLVQTDLSLGLMNDFEAEVKDGLSEGDQVVVAPESSLTAGVKVLPRDIETAP